MSKRRPVNPYDQMPDRTHHGNLESNLDFLQRTGVLDETGQVLEIGPGKGGLLHHLSESGVDIQAVEINEAFIAAARNRSPHLRLTHVSDTTLPFAEESFDVVLSFDVLEHIPDTDSHLTEVRRVLKPNGRYLLQSPNKWTNVVFETIRWRSFSKWRAHHCSLHSYYGFRRRFAKHGFTVTFHDVAVVTEYFKNKLKAYAGRPGLIMLRLANPDRMPMPLRTNYYIEATKK